MQSLILVRKKIQILLILQSEQMKPRKNSIIQQKNFRHLKMPWNGLRVNGKKGTRLPGHQLPIQRTTLITDDFLMKKGLKQKSDVTRRKNIFPNTLRVGEISNRSRNSKIKFQNIWIKKLFHRGKPRTGQVIIFPKMV